MVMREMSAEEVEAMLEQPTEDGDGADIEIENRHGGEFTTTTRVRQEPHTRVIYDRRDGTPTVVREYENNKTLEHMLSKIDPKTGLRIFTLRSPEERPSMFLHIKAAPAHPCWFNAKHPDFRRHIEVSGGARACSKFLATEQDVIEHVKSRHGRSYRMLEDRRAQLEIADDRARQDQMLQAILGLAKQNYQVTAFPFACDQCDFRSASEHGIKIHVGKEHRSAE